MSLDALLQRADLWRGSASAPHAQHVLSSGREDLDALMGGWPQGALTEILADRQGIGEMALLLPALARLTQEDRWLVFIAPPHIPYAPALAQHGIRLARVLVVRPQQPKDTLWALEQALRAGCCGAALAWPARADFTALRRLQLAAEAGDAMGVLYRPEETARQSSPAALRLQLAAMSDELEVRVLKQRGGLKTRALRIRQARVM
jgi:cell division inhibitor SulA/protein ImuA